MDWNVLLSFALGAIAAIIPVIVTNRYQAREKEKDRQEQKREAAIQNRQKWIERDVLEIMNSIDEILKFLGQLDKLVLQVDEIKEIRESELIKEDEVDSRLKSLYDAFSTLHNEIVQTASVMGKLVHSFNEEEVYAAYTDFLNTIRVYEETRNLDNEFNLEIIEGSVSDNWINVQKSAAKFHNHLREKLISLRE